MIELRRDTLRFSFPEVHKHANCSMTFQRTLRIPDDNQTHHLPPGLSEFPLHHVDDFSEKVPAKWNKRGGIFMPMYQAEALWINFEAGSHRYPIAVKVAAGMVDAVTGKQFRNKLSAKRQNYLVLPDQPWLDGFCVQEGLIRQFVAAPLGEGYTAEEQLTGRAEHGGLQIVVYPMKAERYEEMRRADERKMRAGPPDGVYCMADASVPEMGLAPGGMMRQELYEDDYGIDAWDQDVRSRCFVHLLNSGQYRAVTGHAPPHRPPTAEEYTAAGLPWFDYYDADQTALKGAKPLARLDSYETRRVKEGKQPRKGGSSSTPKAGQVVKLGPKGQGGAVRDGGW